MRSVTITGQTDDAFPVPISTGYSVYGGLLELLSTSSEPAADTIHDSDIATLRNSGLLGEFGDSNRDHHKLVLPNETYRLELGVIATDDTEIFDAMARTLVFGDEPLALTNGSITIGRFESNERSHDDLLNEATTYNDPTLVITFRTPTCIIEANEVTSAFPHRRSVFRSLLRRWNATCPDDLTLDLTESKIEGHVYSQPRLHPRDCNPERDEQPLRTHSVLTKRATDDKTGETRNRFRQGFTGTCSYKFKNASPATKNAVVALALFAEYSGVGCAVARGCGHTTTKVI